MGKSRSANSVRNVSFGFAQQLITLVLAFVTRTIFVRKLGAEYTGVNGLYTNILTLLSLAELGIGNVLTYSLYGVLHDNDHEKLKQLISYYRKLYRYIAAAVTVVGLAIVPFLGQGILLGVCIIYTIVVPQGVSGPLYIAVTPVAFGYYLAGNLIHKAGRILKDKQIGEKITGKGNIVLLLVSCALITVLSLYNKPVLMYENSYGNVLISLVTAFIGYYVLSDMAKLMHENAFLQWCGKNSIIVYVVHFSIVQGTRGILVRLLPLPMEILGWIVFVVAVLIVLAVGKICERHFMFAFGK